jgi:peptidoglycan-N-acetylglucosamine deacetylase
MYKFFLVLLTSTLCICSFHSNGQTVKAWNGKQCAVVLTYDDGLNVDLTHAIPALDSVGLKGTFYISDYFNGLHSQLNGWKKAAGEGHELANHTIWHACEGGRTGREFVKDYDLRFYTVKRMDDEILEMNNVLKAIDGKDKRTFAFPCGDTKIHDTAYIDPLRTDFIAARGVKPEMLPINKVDLYNIGCYMINGETGDQLIDLVKKASVSHSLLVFLFHGVGGEHNLNVSLDAHNKLLHYLQQHKSTIWTAPMMDVAEHIRKYQSSLKM